MASLKAYGRASGADMKICTGYGVAAGVQQALVVPVLVVGTAAGTTFLLSTSSLQAR